MPNIKIYEKDNISVWKIEELDDLNLTNVPNWCTYQDEEKFNFLKSNQNIYIMINSLNLSPKNKIAILVNENKDIYSIDEDGIQEDITVYNIPENILESKILIHEERMLYDPFYKAKNS